MNETSEKVQVTYEQVLNFRNEADMFLKYHPGQFRPFTYALSKMLKATKPLEDEFVDKERELNIEYCAKDKNGFAEMEKLTVEKRGEKTEQERMKFTTAQQLILNKKKRELLGEQVDVQPHITKDIPEDLGFDKWTVFAPFVLPAEPSEDQLNELYKATEKKNADAKALAEKMAANGR